MEYTINKGVGREIEFRGLRARYLFVFAGGLLGVFLLIVALSLSGAGQWTCVGVGTVTATALVWGTYQLNNRYGSYGLMKRFAASRHPRRIIHRRKFSRLVRRTLFPIN